MLSTSKAVVLVKQGHYILNCLGFWPVMEYLFSYLYINILAYLYLLPDNELGITIYYKGNN